MLNPFPILLLKNSYLAKLIIWKAHFNNCHLGSNSALTEGVCYRELRGKSRNEPFSNLPASRIRQANRFRICGIDLAGPLYVVTGNFEILDTKDIIYSDNVKTSRYVSLAFREFVETTETITALDKTQKFEKVCRFNEERAHWWCDF